MMEKIEIPYAKPLAGFDDQMKRKTIILHAVLYKQHQINASIPFVCINGLITWNIR